MRRKDVLYIAQNAKIKIIWMTVKMKSQNAGRDTEIERDRERKRIHNSGNIKQRKIKMATKL